MSVVFNVSGEGLFSGVWTSITSAKTFDKNILSIPEDATHWVRFKTGSTAELSVNEKITGGSSSATAIIVAKIIDSGTAAGSDEKGILLLKQISGTPTSTGETWTGASTGTVVTVIAPIELISKGSAKAALISVETAAVNILWNGHPATTTALGNDGHYVAAGGSYLITGWNSTRNFSCINAVNANGAIVKYTIQF